MKIKPIAVIFLFDPKQNSVLLLKRKDFPYNSNFAFPGGKIEIGEEIEFAAIREMKEETAFEFDGMKLLTIVNERVYMDNELADHFLLFYYSVILNNGTHQMSRKELEEKLTDRSLGNEYEMEDINWYPVDELPYAIVPSDKRILDIYFERTKSVPKLIECKLSIKPDNHNPKTEIIIEEWKEFTY